jgi:hypothetical protein
MYYSYIYLYLIGYHIRDIEINADVSLNTCTDIDLAVHFGKSKDMEEQK